MFSKDVKEFFKVISKKKNKYIKVISSSILPSYSISLKFPLLKKHKKQFPLFYHVYSLSLSLTHTHTHTLTHVELTLLYLTMKRKFFKAASKNPLKGCMVCNISGKEYMQRASPVILPLGSKVMRLHHISIAFRLTFLFYTTANIQNSKKRKQQRDWISPKTGYLDLALSQSPLGEAGLLSFFETQWHCWAAQCQINISHRTVSCWIYPTWVN